jgi:phosphatidylserine decarboxylase
LGTTRRILLTALPKLLLSRSTGLLTRVPLPKFARPLVYGWFARRYGADLSEMEGEPRDYRSMAEFFRRPLRDGQRPIADAPIVWPCDGKVITSGAITNGRIPQVKGRDYSVAQLLQDTHLAAQVDGGYQMTIYLAPRDYHRVHSPFDGELLGSKHIPGAFFPVNPGAVDSIPDLFPRNERIVFHYRLPSGDEAAVLMVAALNVGDTLITADTGPISRGAELGQFGFGSTAIVLTPRSGPQISERPRETIVRMGQAP